MEHWEGAYEARALAPHRMSFYEQFVFPESYFNRKRRNSFLTVNVQGRYDVVRSGDERVDLHA